MNIDSKPNRNYKERSRAVNGIIIHSMSEYLNGTHASDFLEEIGLSAHYLISPNGATIVCVDPKHRANHAGISKWDGQIDLNSSYVGIELLISGNHTWPEFLEAIKVKESFTEEHYSQCAALCAELMRKFPGITYNNIVGHSDVSGKEVRPKDPKYDPGVGFDMALLKEKIKLKRNPFSYSHPPDPETIQDYNTPPVSQDVKKKVKQGSLPEYSPKKKKPMLKRILSSKIGKAITGIIGGAAGFGGSIFAGLDPEFALIVAATAVIAIVLGLEKAAKFKSLFDDELNNQDQETK